MRLRRIWAIRNQYVISFVTTLSRSVPSSALLTVDQTENLKEPVKRHRLWWQIWEMGLSQLMYMKLLYLLWLPVHRHWNDCRLQIANFLTQYECCHEINVTNNYKYLITTVLFIDLKHFKCIPCKLILLGIFVVKLPKMVIFYERIGYLNGINIFGQNGTECDKKKARKA